MTADRPALARDHARLATVAAQLRDDRLVGDPAAVESGRLTVAQAHDRARLITAIAAQGADFVAARPLAPQSDRWHGTGGREGAIEQEMRDALAGILKIAASKRPELLDAVEALHWWQQPADRSHWPVSRLTRAHGDADADRFWAAEREAA